MKCECGTELDIITTPIGTGSGPALFGCPTCHKVYYYSVKATPISE